MFNLYQVSDRYLQALSEVTIDNGFDEQTVHDTLSAIKAEDDQQKAFEIAATIRNMQAESKAVHEEERRLRNRRELIEKRCEVLQSFLVSYMRKYNLKKAVNHQFDLKLKKNPPKLEIYDRQIIPLYYLKTEVIEVLDKRMLRNELKNNLTIPGVYLISDYRVEINNYKAKEKQ